MAIRVSSVPVPLDINTADWVTAFFDTADLCNADATAEWFADDIDMRFANNPPASNKVEAREGLRKFMSTIAGMAHQRQERIEDGTVAVQLAIVHYTLPNGAKVSLPVASHLRRNADRLLDRLWIYIDLAPLFDPTK